MGLLDIFKNKAPKAEAPKLEEKPYEITFKTHSNGILQIDFYDRTANIRQFYDVTRLLVQQQPINVNGCTLHNCSVSWYGKGDCHEYDERTNQYDSPRATDYRGVWTSLDLNLLQNDETYCATVMKYLLEQKRVERYLATGLKDRPEEPEKPCGKYIGSVERASNGQYVKQFDIPTGRACHNSDFMVHRRAKIKEQNQKARQKQIMQNKAKIAQLSAEINKLESADNLEYGD